MSQSRFCLFVIGEYFGYFIDSNAFLGRTALNWSVRICFVYIMIMSMLNAVVSMLSCLLSWMSLCKSRDPMRYEFSIRRNLLDQAYLGLCALVADVQCRRHAIPYKRCLIPRACFYTQDDVADMNFDLAEFSGISTQLLAVDSRQKRHRDVSEKRNINSPDLLVKVKQNALASLNTTFDTVLQPDTFHSTP